jgi:putative peptidoglycan lipid II flippase
MKINIGLLHSLGFMSLCSIIQVFAQLFFQVIIASRFGANSQVDAFSAALAIPTMLSAVFTGSVGYVIVPMLVPLASKKEDEEEFKQLAFSLGAWTCLICLLLSAIPFLFSTPITSLLYRGFTELQLNTTAQLLSSLAPLILLGAIQGWQQSIYHSRQHFLLPALANAIGPAATTLLASFSPNGTSDILWVANAMIFGSIIAVLILALPMISHLPSSWRFHASTWKSIQRSIPLFLFNFYSKLDPILDRVLLAGLTVGAIAHLNYAQRFVTALILVISSGVSTVAFPHLAGAATTGQGREFRHCLSENLRRMLLAVLPVIIGCSLFSFSTTRELLERGAFTADDTSAVAMIFTAFIGYFVAAAFGDLIAKSFYALGDTRTPSLIGALGFTIGIGFKVVGVHWGGAYGLAWASSLYYLLNASAMLAILLWRLKDISWLTDLYGTFFRSLSATLIGCLFAWVILRTEIAHIWWFAVAVGAVTYGVVLWVLKDPTFKNMLSPSATLSINEELG